ncbi:MAG: sugar ABC transporter permease [Rhodobacteraceae bacterium]|nr:sugar ABC transporter permease [Paracoccaceae bacterium]
MNDPVFWLVLKNTAIWILGGTFFCVLFGLMVAVYLAVDSRTTSIMRALILLPWVLPDVVTAMAWQWMLHGQVGIVGDTLQRAGVTDGPISLLGNPDTVMWVLVAVVVWRKMPLVALILCAALRSVPDEHYEASKIDGANAWQRFRFIALPHISFSVVAVSVISMVWITAEFTVPWVMTGGGPANSSQIMATYIYQQSFQFFNWGGGAAMSVINLVMLLCIVSLYLYVVRKSWSAAE